LTFYTPEFEGSWKTQLLMSHVKTITLYGDSSNQTGIFWVHQNDYQLRHSCYWSTNATGFYGINFLELIRVRRVSQYRISGISAVDFYRQDFLPVMKPSFYNYKINVNAPAST